MIQGHLRQCAMLGRPALVRLIVDRWGWGIVCCGGRIPGYLGFWLVPQGHDPVTALFMLTYRSGGAFFVAVDGGFEPERYVPEVKNWPMVKAGQAEG